MRVHLKRHEDVKVKTKRDNLKIEELITICLNVRNDKKNEKMSLGKSNIRRYQLFSLNKT